MAVTFAGCGATGKLARIFLFVLHDFTNGRFVLVIQPDNLRIRFSFSVSIISRIFTRSVTERISRLLLDLEALPASLFLRYGVIITVNKVFLNTNTAITRQLMQTARKLEAERKQVLQGSVGTGTKEDNSSTGRV
jgi:hypothetical protein